MSTQCLPRASSHFFNTPVSQHELINQEEQTLAEGTVVGFQEGKVGLQTRGARILGVVSARPIVRGWARM